MKSPLDASNRLQNLLVQEFRACQRVSQLLKDEQQALLCGETQHILAQAVSVDRALEDLRAFQETRLGLAPGVKTNHKTRIVRQPPHPDGRLKSLQEGVQALRAQICETLRSNTALAGKALERTDAMQSHLTSLYNFSPTHPTSETTQTSFPAVLAAFLAMREALNAEDQALVAGAVEELQGALACLGASLAADSITEVWTPAAAQAANDSDLESKGTILVERLTDLHQRRKAYQAVYRSRQCMLGLV